MASIMGLVSARVGKGSKRRSIRLNAKSARSLAGGLSRLGWQPAITRDHAGRDRVLPSREPAVAADVLQDDEPPARSDHPPEFGQGAVRSATVYSVQPKITASKLASA